MKFVEPFNNEPDAKEFLSKIPARQNPELLETIDEETDDMVYIVLYLPPVISRY